MKHLINLRNIAGSFYGPRAWVQPSVQEPMSLGRPARSHDRIEPVLEIDSTDNEASHCCAAGCGIVGLALLSSYA